MNKGKGYRHGQILKVIRSQRVYTQQELAEALRGLGVPATQVTLSRDIHEMGLVKTSKGYSTAVEGAPLGPELGAVIREFLVDARVAQNLLILRTPPANANSVASAIDRAKWPEVVGTIAGDDTILVVAPDHKTALRLRRKLWGFME